MRFQAITWANLDLSSIGYSGTNTRYFMQENGPDFFLQYVGHFVATSMSWWRQQMETSSALLALFEGNHKAQWHGALVCWFFYLRLNRRLSKQSRRVWFETPSRSLWRHCNVLIGHAVDSVPAHRILAPHTDHTGPPDTVPSRQKWLYSLGTTNWPCFPRRHTKRLETK